MSSVFDSLLGATVPPGAAATPRKRRQHTRGPKVPDAPHDLSWAEARAVLAVLEHGHYARAAESLGVVKKTIDSHILSARKKYGLDNALLMYLAFDRYDREFWESHATKGAKHEPL